MRVEISSSDLIEDERLKGSMTVRGFSGSLPVGEEGIVVSSTTEVDAIAGKFFVQALGFGEGGGGDVVGKGVSVESRNEDEALWEYLLRQDKLPPCLSRFGD